MDAVLRQRAKRDVHQLVGRQRTPELGLPASDDGVERLCIESNEV
jgi:hypothetical protein